MSHDISRTWRAFFTGVIDYVDMAKQQAVDIGVQRLIADANSSLKIDRCKLPDTHEQLIVDMSTGNLARCCRVHGRVRSSTSTTS